MLLPVAILLLLLLFRIARHIAVASLHAVQLI
jgi:hypothetical protein